MKKKTAARTISYIALGAAVIALSALITVPFAIPFTLQSFGVFAVLLLLGGKKGLLAVVGYVALGLVGLPVFSGFQGGVGVLFGPTGGFICGFVVAALIYWLCEAVLGGRPWAKITAVSLGMLACYALGSLQYCIYVGDIGFFAALSACVLPYILPDALKLFLAFKAAKLIPKI